MQLIWKRKKLFLLDCLRRLLCVLVSKKLHGRPESLLHQVILADTEFWKGIKSLFLKTLIIILEKIAVDLLCTSCTSLFRALLAQNVALATILNKIWVCVIGVFSCYVLSTSEIFSICNSCSSLIIEFFFSCS